MKLKKLWQKIDAGGTSQQTATSRQNLISHYCVTTSLVTILRNNADTIHGKKQSDGHFIPRQSMQQRTQREAASGFQNINCQL
jgi:hypothetical protein